jgi:hypothetical protein
MSERVELLKTDARGRVRVPQARREELLSEFERSGISGPKFAAMVGVKYQTFAWWVQQRRQRNEREKQGQAEAARAVTAPAGMKAEAAAPRPALKWIEASVEPDVTGKVCAPAACSTLSVRLPGGARLEITDAGQVDLAAQLLDALSGRQRC